jgi:Leucine-rich repeat (LRR) protein
MEIPSSQLKAPTELLSDLSIKGLDVTTVSVYGNAAHFNRLLEFKHLKYLWLSGVNAKSMATVAKLSDLQTLVIHDYRLPDLTNLAGLLSLHSLSIAGSPRIKSISGLEKLKQLQTLILFDCAGFHDLAPLSELSNLHTLCLEGGFSKSLSIDSLVPISGLTSLHSLRLASLRTSDSSLAPLRSLQNLRTAFICKAFPSSEFARLATDLPFARGEFLDSFR